MLFFRTLVDYIMWKVVNQKYIYLSSEYIEIFKFFYLQAYNHWRDSDQRQLCLLTTTLKFSIPLAKVFLDQKFFGDSKKSVRAPMSSIHIMSSNNITIIRALLSLYCDSLSLTFTSLSQINFSVPLDFLSLALPFCLW